jgi:hypothetical protein
LLGKVSLLPPNLWLGWDCKATISTRVLGVSFTVMVVLFCCLLLLRGSWLSLSLECAHHCGRIMIHDDSIPASMGDRVFFFETLAAADEGQISADRP